MADANETKMIRDMLGSPVPQTLNDDGTYSVMANGDVSNVDFRRKKLLRDRLGGILPQQYYDVNQGRFVPGTIGGGGDVSQEDLLNLSNEVNEKVEEVTTQLAQVKEDMETVFQSASNGKLLLEEAIEQKGSTVNKAGEFATFEELRAGISAIEGGGSGTNTRFLYQSEYDALSESEKNNGMFYFIKE